MNNNASLRFGPAPTNTTQAVGIAFVSSPAMQPDYSVALLDTYKFAKENVSGLRDYVIANTFTTGKIKLQISYAGTSLLGMTSALGSWTLADSARQIDLDGNEFVLTAHNTQIKTTGIKMTSSGAWGIGVTPGVVFRNYTIPTYEQSDVWFRNIPDLAGTAGIGKQVLLVYSVPEASYNARSPFPNTEFPGSNVDYNLVKEDVSASGPNTIKYSGNLDFLNKIIINGVQTYTAGASGSVDYIKTLNKDLNTIEIRGYVNPDDRIVLEYYTYAQDFTYLGYRDNNKGAYFPFDINPEYGHFIGDSRYNTLRCSSNALIEQVTLYAIPSAVGVYNILPPNDSSGLPILDIKFYSAYSYGESHFIRHAVGAQLEEIVPRLSDGPPNTYGFALFGRNYYDESSVPKRDIFSRTIPSMLPLGRAILKAPINPKTVNIADIRIRGGGVPEYADFNLLRSEPDAIKTLKRYYDLGNWDGQAVQDGGVVTITINPDVLDVNGGNFSEAEVAEIVVQRIPPGIEYEIVYEVIN